VWAFGASPSPATVGGVFPVGGVEVMLLLVAASGVLCGLLALVLQRRLGWLSAVAIAGFVWSLAVIGTITLIPANGAPGIVSAEGRLTTCSWDIGGPAPDGFWIFSGGQRLLNVVVFVPSGALLVLACARWRAAWVLVPLGLAGLAAYSIGIEATQLALARIDRACDVTDVIDNVTGAALGVGAGIVLAVLLRPWRHRRTA
jgi:VanZ like protein